MSVWASLGVDIDVRLYVHSGHIPKRADPAALIDLAIIPDHLTRGVWIRLAVWDGDAMDVRVVLDKRGATKLRDALTAILDGERG